MPNHTLSTMKFPLMNPDDAYIYEQYPATNWKLKHRISTHTCFPMGVDDLIPNRAISGLLARNTTPNTLEVSSTKLVRKKRAAHAYRFMATIKEDIMHDNGREGACISLQVMATASTHAMSIINDENSRGMIIGSNSIEHMLTLLHHGNHREKELGACVLYRLAAHEENRILIAQKGGIPPLLDIIQNGTTSQKKQAVPAIASLAFRNNSNKLLIARAGGISPLLRLIQNGTDKEKSLAVKAVYCLATNKKIRDEISQKGGIELITGIVVKKDTPSDLKRYSTATLRLFSNKTIKPEIDRQAKRRWGASRKKRSGSTSTWPNIFPPPPELWNWLTYAFGGGIRTINQLRQD